MRNMTERPIPPIPAKQSTMDFERELLYAFRGELRKVNDLLSPDLRNTGTAFRIAAAAIGRALAPQSEDGRHFLTRYMKQRPAETLYSPVGLGAEVKKTMDRVRLTSGER